MFEHNGQWYILGNRTLNNLNLTRNGITIDGVKALLDALNEQDTGVAAVAASLAGGGSSGASVVGFPVGGGEPGAVANMSLDGLLGLFRLSLQENPFDKTNPTFLHLQNLLNSRNPFIAAAAAAAAIERKESSVMIEEIPENEGVGSLTAEVAG
ncbi:hypothetical protein HK102_002623 [Quaeritorhiza haematococci]|nr:hypothetical protein HK102_002623 [Quaeritorhiza haematococci]